MSEIVKVIGREIVDSRGNPIVGVDVLPEDASMGGGKILRQEGFRLSLRLRSQMKGETA